VELSGHSHQPSLSLSPRWCCYPCRGKPDCANYCLCHCRCHCHCAFGAAAKLLVYSCLTVRRRQTQT
jgi:hypothetical protein